MRPSRNLASLDDDVLEKIAECLSEKDRCKLSSTSKRFRDLFRRRPSEKATVTLHAPQSIVSYVFWVRPRRPLRQLTLTLAGGCWKSNGSSSVFPLESLLALVSDSLETLAIDIGKVGLFDPVWLQLLTQVRDLTIRGCDGTLNVTSLSMPAVDTMRIEGTFPTYIVFGDGMARLKTLSMVRCGLGMLPERFSCLTSLEHLVLDGNKLSGIWKWSFPNLTNLRTLSMRKCSLIGVPNVAACTGLTSLDLSYNSIVQAHEDENAFEVLSEMKNLVELNVSHNAMDDATISTVGTAPNLTVLDISGNYYWHLPRFRPPLLKLRRLVTSPVFPMHLPDMPLCKHVEIHACCPSCPIGHRHLPLEYGSD